MVYDAWNILFNLNFYYVIHDFAFIFIMNIDRNFPFYSMSWALFL